MSLIKSLKKKKLFFSIFFLANLQDISKVQIIKIFGELPKFRKGQKSKLLKSQSDFFLPIFFGFTPSFFFFFLGGGGGGQSFFSKFLIKNFIFFLNSKSRFEKFEDFFNFKMSFTHSFTDFFSVGSSSLTVDSQ